MQKGNALLLALCLIISPAALATDGENPPRDSPSTRLSEVDLPVLESRIQELRKLLSSIDGVLANLIRMAEKTQTNADAAPNLTERRHYDQLYTETSIRLGELNNTRAEIIRLLDELETQLEALRRAQ